jgi:hypothetical protein
MYPNTTTDPRTLPESIRQLLYLPSTGPGQREPFCTICRDDIGPDQPSATHQCCGTTLCKRCFLSYILQKTWDSKTNVSLAADCPYCKRPILRPHPYAHDEIIMVATTVDLVRQCVGDYVFYARPLNSRQQGDLLSDEQAMMMLDPQGQHPRAQQQYEEMKSHQAAGWRVFCFKEASPSTFLVAEGWKTPDQYASDLSNVHPALRQPVAHTEAPPSSVSTLNERDKAVTQQVGRHIIESASRQAENPGTLRKLWHTITSPVQISLRSDGWKLAYAGSC